MFDAQFNFPVGVIENENKENLFIYRIYPNPATSFIEIEFYLQEEETVTVTIFNPLGQYIGTPIEQSFQTGMNKTKVDLSTYSSGVYLLKLLAGKHCQTKKVQIFK